METIRVDTAALQAKAAELRGQSQKLNGLANKLRNTKDQIMEVWVDSKAAAFALDISSDIEGLRYASEQARTFAEICDLVCREYKTADNQILDIL